MTYSFLSSLPTRLWALVALGAGVWEGGLEGDGEEILISLFRKTLCW